MRGARLLALEIGALLLTVPVLFCLVMGTALVPREGLGVGRDYDDFCTPPGSVPWWLLGLGIALALLAVAMLLVRLAWWARTRRKPGGGLSPVLARVLQAIFFAGVAIVTSWTLWVHVNEWAWYADRCSSVEPALHPPMSVSTYLVQILFAAIGVTAIAGTVLHLRRAYRAYVLVHEGRPLRARTMFGIAGAVVVAALLGVVFFSSFTLREHLQYDTVPISCDDSDRWCGLERLPPAGLGTWLWIGAAQAVALAGMLVALRLARAPFRKHAPRKVRLGAVGCRVVAVTWAVGIAVTAGVDLSAYVGLRVQWARVEARESDVPFAYPTEDVRAGVWAAAVVTVISVALACFLLWWSRRRRALGTPAPAESSV